jgi:hypothetical protein
MHLSWNLILVIVVLSSAFPQTSCAERPGRNFGSSKTVESAFIGGSRIALPLNRFIIIRRDKDLCALKFTDAFTFGYGYYKDKPVEAYASYEIYSQRNGAGDFQTSDSSQEVELVLPESRGFWSSLFAPREKTHIECGSTNLSWAVGTGVHFFSHPDDQDYPEKVKKYGVELAPTPWTKIQEVNLKDQRLKWYRYDPQRAEEKILVEKLWPNPPLEPSR